MSVSERVAYERGEQLGESVSFTLHASISSWLGAYTWNSSLIY